MELGSVNIKIRAHRQWFAIQTRVGKESYARAQFERQAFEVYLPGILQRCSHAGKISWQQQPFFPGYLFLHLAPDEQRWTTIRSTYGAIGAARFGNYYPPVPDAVIHALQARHDDSGLIVLSSSRPEAPFKHGEKVRVIHGPMSDIEAVFQYMKGRDRVLVLMNLLGRQSKVELPVDLVAQTG
jgi:transcriptional antiterminator RfaH